MSTATNQAIVLRLVDEYFNQRQEAAWDELTHSNVVIHGTAQDLHSAAEAKAWYANVLFAACPNLHFSVEDVIAADDKVVLRYTESGTMTGSFLGMSPTGKSFTIPAVTIFRLAAGKVIEMWGFRDTAEQIRQLGLRPPQR